MNRLLTSVKSFYNIYVKMNTTFKVNPATIAYGSTAGKTVSLQITPTTTEFLDVAEPIGGVSFFVIGNPFLKATYPSGKYTAEVTHNFAKQNLHIEIEAADKTFNISANETLK